LLTPSVVSRIAWIRDRTAHLVARRELGEQLVQVMDVPRTLDLRQHHDVELVASRSHDLRPTGC
jgi:hypothetical protein